VGRGNTRGRLRHVHGHAVLNRNFQTFNASVGEVPTCAWNPQITGGYAELAA
jgi:hypothetical protein